MSEIMDLSIQWTPLYRQAQESLRMNEDIMKTYKLSKESVDMLEKLSKRLSAESKLNISRGAVIEMALRVIENYSFQQLIKNKTN